MFHISCRKCGATEEDDVMVFKEDTNTRRTSPNTTISEDIRTTFYCDQCDHEETVNTGVLPETSAEHFQSARASADDRLTVKIDEQEVPYQGVDEQIAENAYYTAEGVRGTSKVHHVHIHIHAEDPPSFSKGKHQVKIGDYLTAEMILGTVRYHDENNRTLKFFRSLNDDVMEPLDKETDLALNAKAERY